MSFGSLAFDWQHKHRLCELETPGSVEFISPRRTMPRNFDDRIYNRLGYGPQWLDWRPNADVKLAYAADAAMTMDLSALNSSSTFTLGRESTAVDNTANLYLDFRITGTYIAGTTPTTPAETRLYLIIPTDDTPAWPDVFDGTDSNETVTNSNILDTLPMLWSGTVGTTSNQTYPIISAMTVAQVLGFCPSRWGLFFTHFHTAALKTDAGNTNSIYRQGLYATVI